MANVGEINDENKKNDKNEKNDTINNSFGIAEILANIVVACGDDLDIYDIRLKGMAIIIALREKLERIGNLIVDEKISKEEFEKIKEPLRALDTELAKFLILNKKI